MMNEVDLLKKLDSVKRIASLSKFGRLFHNPFKYIHAIVFRELNYKRNKKSKEVVTSTFFDKKMHILLPASTDIYLTKGKSHDSEIRLAKFIIKQLSHGDTFIDVGAHYGYFTLLASTIVGATGKVFSFEASHTNFSILQKNTTNKKNIAAINKAVSDKNGEISFYEFPNLYAEYNSMDIRQFNDEAWFKRLQPKKIIAQSVKLSDTFEARSITPNMIKIDVEGAELKVIKGLSDYLQNNTPTIIMEYLCKKRNNVEHKKAVTFLKAFTYNPFTIDDNGTLQPCVDIEEHMDQHQLESDNIVFIK